MINKQRIEEEFKMMTSYTYICKRCDSNPCKINILAENTSILGGRCRDRNWMPTNKCFAAEEKVKWEIYSIIPEDIV